MLHHKRLNKATGFTQASRHTVEVGSTPGCNKSAGQAYKPETDKLCWLATSEKESSCRALVGKVREHECNVGTQSYE